LRGGTLMVSMMVSVLEEAIWMVTADASSTIWYFISLLY
jgi:hypothetical protein